MSAAERATVFEANVIDWRHSVVQAHERADAGDEALEICPYCECEVDIDPQPHKPGCRGIGQPRVSSTPVLASASLERGLDALERMDAGEPQLPEPEFELDGGEVDLDDEDVGGAEVGNREGDDEPQVSVRVARSPSAGGEETAPAGQDGSETSERVRVGAPDKPRGWSRKKVTRETAIESLRRVAAELGHTPYVEEWKRLKARPAQSTFYRLFGGWDEAVAAAGLPPAASPGRKRATGASKSVSTRQEPPIVWAVKVAGTGLRYRTVDEALVAADEIEHDGERVARQARVDGQEGKADQAIDAARALAAKIRAACDLHEQHAESIPAASEEREGRRLGPDASRSSGADIAVAAVSELDPLTLTGDQTAGWIARLEAESERLHRRARAFDTIAEGLRLLAETDV